MLEIKRSIGRGFTGTPGSLYDTLIALQLESGLLPISGVTYFVSQMGNNTDGLSWEKAFTTLSAAITASNTFFDATGTSRISRNRIFVDGTNYAGLTILPKHCDIIGVGTNPRINAASKIETNVDGCHIYNMKFRNSASAPVFWATAVTNGLEFHSCVFDSSGWDTTHYLQLHGHQTIKIVGCQFTGACPAPIGIQIDGSFMYSEITGNTIVAVTSGIVIVDAVATLDYNSYIRDNIISYTQASVQMTYGIDIQNAGSASRIMIVNNWISAADGIHYVGSGYENHRDHWMCIGNIINVANGSIYETTITRPA